MVTGTSALKFKSERYSMFFDKLLVTLGIYKFDNLNLFRALTPSMVTELT